MDNSLKNEVSIEILSDRIKELEAEVHYLNSVLLKETNTDAASTPKQDVSEVLKEIAPKLRRLTSPLLALAYVTALLGGVATAAWLVRLIIVACIP